MASSSDVDHSFFANWEVLFNSIKKKIIKKADVLICLAHFVLISEDFKCLGNGEDKILMEIEQSTEWLPDGWNENEFRYALRYVHDIHLYILFGLMVNESIVINLLNISTTKVSNICLNPEILVSNINGTNVSEVLPDAEFIRDKLYEELVEPVFIKRPKNVTTQTESPHRRFVKFNRHFSRPRVLSVRHMATTTTEAPTENGRRNVMPATRSLIPVLNYFHPIHVHEQERGLQMVHSANDVINMEAPLAYDNFSMSNRLSISNSNISGITSTASANNSNNNESTQTAGNINPYDIENAQENNDNANL